MFIGQIYDKIRYDTIYWRALKSWRYGDENKEKLITKPSSLDETARTIVREGREEEMKLRGRICKTGRF